MMLIAFIFILPLVAIMTELIISEKRVQLKKSLQLSFSLSWLILSLLLCFSAKSNIVINLGSWPAPFGICLVFDKLTCLMLTVFAIVALCIYCFSLQDSSLRDNRRGFLIGFWLLLLGILGTLSTADIFNLYVWFELMLVSAFILLGTLENSAFKAIAHYAIINILGTLLMLLAISFLYAKYGTLNYADIANLMTQNSSNAIFAILGLLLFAMAIKAAIFPLYFWLPVAYPQASYSATMMLSSMITKVVMLVILRMVWLWPPLHASVFTPIFLVAAWATMALGVLGAANQFFIKRILSFHIISQLGYILLAITMPTNLAVVATVYFIIHNIFVKTNLFMVSAGINHYYNTDDLHHLGGLAKQHKWLAIMFFIAAMSLAGFPPLSGFWAKFLLIKAALESHFYVSAGVAIFVSLFTLYSMIKIWRYVFSEPAQQPISIQTQKLKLAVSYKIACIALLILPILMGLFPDIILKQLHIVAVQLQAQNAYIGLVLGK
jgi:multicomponent Na+:H+ antiporter subunit D